LQGSISSTNSAIVLNSTSQFNARSTVVRNLGTEVQFRSDLCQVTCCMCSMWLWRVTVAFAFFQYNFLYKMEVLTCAVDKSFVKYYNFLTFTCLSVVQNETRTHTQTHKEIQTNTKMLTQTQNTQKHTNAHTQYEIHFRVHFISNFLNFTYLSCDFTHTNTQKTTHTQTHTHVLSVNINLPSVRSAMCQPTIQFTVSRSPLQHSVAERKVQQTAVFGSVRIVRTSKGN
jgi:hypothetical protein